ncbi:succinyl-diaminopimelate desuccinylase [Gymnodinialimonas ceratoperidinii]|uniref:Succinyl-diaminopimelate desuccinylase n=1 Tax=Gymnodinialimonas ceratoperidinii TaxID=2856823 RepID=A0A8F6YB29_9RHOB|nr:succinyl-diaminopimelate desuccinylase [Gymnodinialimonas ceratoperidinii]QXT40133.1 succinyl-diaminopimelate desuccinylase [Gymnodinialimonas ceratoperidinii]
MSQVHSPASSEPVDPVALTAELIRCNSVTPLEGGALVLLEKLLSEAGFTCTRVDRGGIANLYARWGTRGNGRAFGFNGHTDVVPVGDEAAWTHPPFGAEVEGEWMYGRGATDMKSGVAAFAAAAIDFVRQTPPDGAVVLAITGDEEGESTDGTIALLDWMEETGERIDVCIVGEPTCPEEMGDMMKIGRRGALTAFFEVIGKQGHSAYLHKVINPLPAVALLGHRLSTHVLDEGTEHFDPTTCAITTIDTGNPANNVIPARTKMTVNLRFNDTHTGESLTQWLRAEADRVAEETGTTITMTTKLSGESFLTPPGDLSTLVGRAVEAETGRTPKLSTTGGTSDARFVKNHCPVVEFGLVGHRMHQVDERVRISDIEALKRVYTRVLTDYFAE